VVRWVSVRGISVFGAPPMPHAVLFFLPPSPHGRLVEMSGGAAPWDGDAGAADPAAAAARQAGTLEAHRQEVRRRLEHAGQLDAARAHAREAEPAALPFTALPPPSCLLKTRCKAPTVRDPIPARSSDTRRPPPQLPSIPRGGGSAPSLERQVRQLQAELDARRARDVEAERPGRRRRRPPDPILRDPRASEDRTGMGGGRGYRRFGMGKGPLSTVGR